MNHLSPLLEPLGALAEETGKIAQAERANLVRDLKPDGSIVTSADRNVETFLRKKLPELLPKAGFWGEEFGFEPEGENGLWAVDPIDGTSNYFFGSPLWGISIALLVRGRIELGCVVLPDLNEVYLASRNGGSSLNGNPITPIPPGPVLPEELVSFNETAAKGLAGARIPGKRRDFGAFVISGAFVAMQRCRGLVGMNEKLYDCAASILLCKELGAEIRYVDGSHFDVAALTADVKITKPWLIFPAGSGFVVSQ